MAAWVNRLLNALLALMVATSIFLSLQIWYPTVEIFPTVVAQPSVQPQPPASVLQMPDILRPEVIQIRQEKGLRMAPLHAGSQEYKQLWSLLREVLTGLQTGPAGFPVDNVGEQLKEADTVQIHLPIALTMGEWADQLLWNSPGLRNASIRIDRVTIYLSDPGVIYLSGPSGTIYYLAELPSLFRAQIAEQIEQVDPMRFTQQRPIEHEDLMARVGDDLLVPEVGAMPVARIRTSDFNERDEEMRYFPDLSVVRQIDERDARSLTDGQRLLRFLTTGVLEYRTADSSSTAPGLPRAISMAQEWVGSHGGWPQEIVLRRFVRQPRRAILEFDYRDDGPYPVESVGGGVQVHVSSQRVVYYRRYPAAVSTSFGREEVAIISPEQAIALAMDQVPLILTETIRGMHLAYHLKPDPEVGPNQWLLEPVWVIQAGEVRVYQPAAVGREKIPPVISR